MCGLFGFVANRNSDKGPDLGVLREIALVTQTRGAHAFGFAWVDRWGVLKMFKQEGPIGDHLSLLAMVRGCRLLIGHCRYATVGSPTVLSNNHPHPVNGGWFVHNGTLRDYPQLVREYGLWPMTECDSEVLGLLAEQNGGSDADRMAAAVLCTEEAPLATLALWRSPRRLVAIRRGKPLHLGIRGGAAYIGSLADGLPGKVWQVADRTMLDFNSKGTTHVSL